MGIYKRLECSQSLFEKPKHSVFFMRVSFFRVSSFELRTSSFELKTSSFEFETSSFELKTSSFE